MVKQKHETHDLVVVGGGIAGLTAATHAIRLGMRVVLVEKELLYGGQIANIDIIDGPPAFREVSGIELSTAMVNTVRASGGIIANETATLLEEVEGKIRLETDADVYCADAVIVATGADLRRLRVPGEEALIGRGVSQCATCDGPFFRGQDVVVVGGGDAALQEALVLAELCRTVSLVTRSAFKAKRSYIERISSCDNVRFHWNSTVESILGEEGVCAVRIKENGADRTDDIDCTGVFPFIGSVPNTAWLPRQFVYDPEGAIGVEELKVLGACSVYAIGAARSGYNGQIATAAGEAVSAVETIARARQS